MRVIFARTSRVVCRSRYGRRASSGVSPNQQSVASSARATSGRRSTDGRCADPCAHFACRVSQQVRTARIERRLAATSTALRRASRATSGAAPVCTSMSPREMSISSASTSVTASCNRARGCSPSQVRMARMCVVRPEGSTVTASPTPIEPASTRPMKPRGVVAVGRATYWTGKRKGAAANVGGASAVSRICSSVGPSYHDRFAPRSTTMSPSSADIGTKRTSSMPVRSAKARKSATMAA